MKIFLKHAKKCWPYILFSLLIIATSVTISLYMPKITAGLINEGIGKLNVEYIKVNGSKMLILNVMLIIFSFLNAYIFPKIEYYFSNGIRTDIYKKVNELSIANLNDLSSETILTRLTSDVQNVSILITNTVNLIQVPFLIIIAFILSVKIDLTLSLLLIAILPVALIILWISNFFAKPLFKRLQKKKDEMNNFLIEDISGIRDIKTYGLEEDELKNFDSVNKDIRDLSKKSAILINILTPIMSLVAIFFAIIILMIGTDKIFFGKLTAGELLAFVSYASNIITGISIAIGFISIYIKSSASLDRIKEILNMETKIKNPENPVLEMPNNSIEFQNVYFNYGKDEDVLKGVSFKIDEGKSLGIIGTTGSGKSTIAELINRNYDPNSGKILIGGIDIKNYDLEFLNSCVAKIEQESKIFSGTIKSNIKIADKNMNDSEVEKYISLAQAENFVSKYTDGIEHITERNGSNLSGGQKQRVSIARGIAKKANIIIIDDATSALDFDTERKIQKMIDKKLRPNLTKIIISQRINSIKNCDQIIVMNNGKIEAYGNHESLLKTSELYNRTYVLQGGEA